MHIGGAFHIWHGVLSKGRRLGHLKIHKCKSDQGFQDSIERKVSD